MDVERRGRDVEAEPKSGIPDVSNTAKVGAVAAALVYPGLILGAILAYWFWSRFRTPSKYRAVFSLAAAAAGILSGAFVPIWISGEIITGTITQALVGPAALFAVHQLGRRRHGGDGLARQEAPGTSAEHQTAEKPEDGAADREAPADDRTTYGVSRIELGRTISGARPVDLELPGAIARHVTVSGDTGTGKTTTLVRIIHDCLAAGYAIVVVDAKGVGSFRDACEGLSEKFGVPLGIVDPAEPETMKYNPARGTPAQIANKLIGAFSYGRNGEVYKNLNQEVVPVLAQGLRDAGQPVTLKQLAANLDVKKMVGLSREGEGAAAEELASFGSLGKLHEQTIAGMRGRFNALMWGEYGPVFDVAAEEDGLDIYEALKGGLTYVSLPAMASSEDSELMARVLIQDLKQVAAARIGSKRRAGVEERPAVLVMDEFSAFREADQVTDLLLQAREARISCVLSSQFLPQSSDLRKSLLAAGLLITHAVGEEDARDLARAFGTREKLDVSTSFRPDDDEDEERRVSGRKAEKYLVEPREIQGYGVGKAAVRLRYEDTRKIERVEVLAPRLTGGVNG